MEVEYGLSPISSVLAPDFARFRYGPRECPYPIHTPPHRYTCILHYCYYHRDVKQVMILLKYLTHRLLRPRRSLLRTWSSVPSPPCVAGKFSYAVVLSLFLSRSLFLHPPPRSRYMDRSSADRITHVCPSSYYWILLLSPWRATSHNTVLSRIRAHRTADTIGTRRRRGDSYRISQDSYTRGRTCRYVVVL